MSDELLSDEDLGISPTEIVPSYKRQKDLYLHTASLKNGDQPVTDEEFLGPKVMTQRKSASAGLLSDLDLGITTQQQPMPQWTFKENLQQTLKEAGYNTLGSVATLADMFAGLPGMAMNIGAYVGSRIMTTGQRESNSVSAKMSKEVAADLVPDAVSAPFHKIMESLGYGDEYNESTIAKGMNLVTEGINKGADWLSSKTGGLLQPEDFEVLAQVGMLALGTRGGDAALKKAIVEKETAKARQTYDPNYKAPGSRVEPTVGQQSDFTPDATWKSADSDTPVQILEPDFGEANGRKFTKVRNSQGTESIVPSDELIAKTDQQHVVETNAQAEQALQSPNSEQGMYQNGTQGPTGPTVRVPGKPNLRPKSTPEQMTVLPDNPTVEDVVQVAKNTKPSGAESAGLGAAAVAAGGWMYMNPEDADAIGVGGLAMAGAIKGKGGMWHPEAVTRLSDPLFRQIDKSTFGPEVMRDPNWESEIRKNNPPDVAEKVIKGAEESKSLIAWTDSRIKSYLNKHAGTDTDPLKDVKVPMMGEDVRWEDLTDKLIFSEPAINLRGRLRTSKTEISPGVPPNEPVWQLDNTPIQSANAITSYLSHVGDYLREFVPVDKLQQYDLVRAVKETAKQDEIQAAKMAKARVNQASTVLVKEYPDGMRWVEVGKIPEDEGLPKGYTIEPGTGSHEHGFQVRGPDGKVILSDKGYIPALHSEAEAIKFAKESVTNAALKNEGDIMGTCVGGYCEMVHSGESRIYSLRDAKGMSHVTIEVAPEGVSRGKSQYGTADASYLSDIIQIKGKQNRAPVDAYKPYVQDFVKNGADGKGGKWGEVGDITNAGLLDLSTLANNKALGDKVTQLAQSMIDKGERYVNYDDWKRDVGIPPRREQGNIDPKLLARMAAVGVGIAGGIYLDPDHPIMAGLKGAMLGIAAGAISSRAVVNSIKNILSPTQLVKIDKLRNWTEYERKASARTLWQAQTGIEELASKPEQQVKLTRAIRNNDTTGLTAKEAQAFTKAKTFFNDMYQYATQQGAEVIKTFENNYVTQLWGQGGKDLLEHLRTSGGTGSGSGTTTPYSIKRTLTFDEGIAAGLKPLTEDLSTIMGIYGNSVIKAVENKKFVNILKNVRAPATGNKLLMKDGTGVPKDYTYIDHPQLRNLRVHPDIAPDLKFIFDANDPSVIFRGLEALNTTQKRMAVSMSLFHAKALEDAMLGASKLVAAPMRVVKSLGQAALPRVFGENSLVKEIRTGGAGDLVDKAQKAGLEFSFQRRAPVVEEINKGFYEGMTAVQKIIDHSLPGVGKLTIGNFVKLNHGFDNFMWGRLHAGLKLDLFAEKYGQLLKNNVKAHADNPAKFPLKSNEQVATIAASFTNDIFGGLNWQRLAMEPSTRAGREITSALLSPGGRRFMRLALFAPDWTISTTRAFVKAFGPGSGVKGLFKPTELADLHRQYILRSAFWYTVIGDSLNYAMTGHHFWENKDPTRLELGDGRTMQWSKHSMEPIHWLTMPGQQALNKLGYIPKELATQALHKEYLSTTFMPEMKNRLAHAAKAFSPIAANQAFDNDGEDFDAPKAVAGFLGAPIYGRTEQQKQLQKARAKLQRAERKASERARSHQ